MKSSAVSFFIYVERILNPYKWALSMAASLMMAAFFSFIVVKGQIDSDKQILTALSPYIATLAESSDRPEILRVLENTSKAKGADLLFVKNGQIFGASGSMDQLDLAFQKPTNGFHVLNVLVSNGKIISSAKVMRLNGAPDSSELYIFSDLWPILRNTTGIFVVTFLVCIAFAFFASRQMNNAIKKALRPLDQLHREIENLPSFKSGPSEPIRIHELEIMRQVLMTTKVDLENAKDRLAEEKAKKMSAHSYKQLIHDLHNPVAAFRQRVKLAFDPNIDEATKAEIFETLPEVADQILGQVTSARKNLEEEPIALRESDLLQTVSESVDQVSIITADKEILTENYCSDALVAHDPTLLKRALVNLLENAVSAAQSVVRISVSKDSQGASIRICDDGAGMDESLIPLYLQGRGRSGKANRQAFGLSSTNHIVRSHGGKLIYRRSNMGGSSFEIRLGAI